MKSVFEDSVCPVSVFYVPNTNWALRSYAAYEIVAFTLDRQTLLSPLDVFALNWPFGAATLWTDWAQWYKRDDRLLMKGLSACLTAA